MNSICFTCGKEMIQPVNSITELENGIVCTEFNCPECGAIEFVYSVNDEMKEDYPYYEEEHDEDDDDTTYYGGTLFGKWICPHCGEGLIWDNDFMRSEILDDVTGEEDEYGCLKDDSVCHCCSCPKCGYSVDLIEAKPSEYKNYPFYKKEGETKDDNNS